MTVTKPAVKILGTRGVPGNHSGFEYFADHFSRWLAARGYDVIVYCQADRVPRGSKPKKWEDTWEGVRRVHYETRLGGTPATMEFDLLAALDAARRPGVDLVLGYNTAIFNLLQLLRKPRVYMNMDGIEWARGKWSLPAKVWFFFNELVGANAFHPIADHPEIARHVSARSFRTPVVIPYASEAIYSAPVEPLQEFGIEPGKYFISIARIVPENSIDMIVEAFRRYPYDDKLVVLGKLDDSNPYHRKLRSIAGQNVLFPGPIFDKARIRSLRYHALAYMHGHTVGGTNPSLVEALGAGNAVIAHDNKFNRWTAGPDQLYFGTIEQCTEAMRRAREDDSFRVRAREGARKRHAEAFTFDIVHGKYLEVLVGDHWTDKNAQARKAS